MVILLSGAELGWWLGNRLLVSVLLLEPSQGPDLLNTCRVEGSVTMPPDREGYKDPWWSIVVSVLRKGRIN